MTKALALLCLFTLGFNSGMIFERFRHAPYHEEMCQLHEANGALKYKWSVVYSGICDTEKADSIFKANYAPAYRGK